MAHMIDESTGRAAIAYVGKKPWHELGQELTPGASIEEWTYEAGLAYKVIPSNVMYSTDAVSAIQEWPERKVLYRNDNGAPLAVVSKDYRVVQPWEVMEFFGKLAEIGGFELETAGALSGGRRIWALARVGPEAEVVDGDMVRSYVLVGTSYDGTMATIAKHTNIRVVCNNTITASLNANEGSSDGYLKNTVRVLHSERFNADEVRLQLGIVKDQFERFIVQSRQLAHEPMSAVECDAFVRMLLKPYHAGSLPVEQSRAYKRIMDLFHGAAIGSDISGIMGTRWQALNAVTQLIDHEKGRTTSTRMESAWFGTGEKIKNRALELLVN